MLNADIDAAAKTGSRTSLDSGGDASSRDELPKRRTS
jgi:hypothetical protein